MRTERVNNCNKAVISQPTKKWVALMARYEDLTDDITSALKLMYGDTMGANLYDKSFALPIAKMYDAFREHLGECICLSIEEHNYKQI